MIMKILFVCTGNACRSPAAEALLTKFNPKIDVDSAGTHAYYKIIDVTRTYLIQEKAEQHLKYVPEPLENKQLDDYDLIVAMEHKHKDVILHQCPECAEKVIVWNIDDPYKLPIAQAERIFTRIKRKTQQLARSVS